MKFLDFRKYFFANVSTFWSLLILCFIFKVSQTNYPPHNPDNFITDEFLDFYFILKSIELLLWIFGLTILEFIIRKYLIEKKFPNFRLNINIKFPKFIIIFYNIIFSIGFLSASVLSLLGILFLIIYQISEMLVSS